MKSKLAYSWGRWQSCCQAGHPQTRSSRKKERTVAISNASSEPHMLTAEALAAFVPKWDSTAHGPLNTLLGMVQIEQIMRIKQ